MLASPCTASQTVVPLQYTRTAGTNAAACFASGRPAGLHHAQLATSLGLCRLPGWWLAQASCHLSPSQQRRAVGRTHCSKPWHRPRGDNVAPKTLRAIPAVSATVVKQSQWPNLNQHVTHAQLCRRNLFAHRTSMSLAVQIDLGDSLSLNADVAC